LSISWDKVPHFTREEFDDPFYPGSGDMIDGVLLHMLVKTRIETGWPMIPHAKVGGCVDVDGAHGHSPRSYHRRDRGCKACDFHFRTNAPPREQFYLLTRMGFTGVGVYFDWHWDEKLLPIGFHVDLRPRNRTQYWTRRGGEYIYLLGR